MTNPRAALPPLPVKMVRGIAMMMTSVGMALSVVRTIASCLGTSTIRRMIAVLKVSLVTI